MVLIIVEGGPFPIFCPEMKTNASILIYTIIEIQGSSNFMMSGHQSSGNTGIMEFQVSL